MKPNIRILNRYRRIFCELLETRQLLAGMIDDHTAADVLRANVSQGPDVVYYDSWENGELQGGKISATSLKSNFTAMNGPAIRPMGVSTTLVNNGPSSNRIDLVFVGDGYTSSQLGTYATHVDSIYPSFFAEEPLDEYSTFFNIHRVDVISTESGVDNDPTQGVSRNTALDMGYWCGGIARLLCVDTTKAYNEANSAPDVDQVLAIANSATYGGAGYPSANLGTLAGGNSAGVELALHEFGHSFADLADEYDYGGSSNYTGPEPTEANVSIYNATQMASQQTKWNAWLPETNVDTFEGARYSQTGIYRPTNDSKMRSLNRPFEQINIEQFVVSAYKTVRPIDSATAPGTYPQTQIFSVNPVDPVTHALSVQWSIDGNPISGATSTTFNPSTLNLTVGNHTLSVKVVDNTPLVRDTASRNTWLTESRSWTLNVAHSITVNLGPNVGSYRENAAAVRAIPNATLNDNGFNTYAGGVVSVKVSYHANANDRLGIRSQGNNAGQISASGGTLRYGGTVIGSYVGGSGANPLKITLNGSASPAAVQALLQNIIFKTLGDAPSTLQRRLQVVFNNGQGYITSAAVRKMNVVAVNDAPVLSQFSGSLNYTRNSNAVVLASNATIVDADNTNFAGGKLTATISAGQNNSNRLQLGGGFTFNGSQLLYNAIVIGARNTNGGFGTIPLELTFNANATSSRVQLLLRNLRFKTVLATDLAQRTVQVALTDGAGGTSNLVNKLITVST